MTDTTNREVQAATSSSAMTGKCLLLVPSNMTSDAPFQNSDIKNAFELLRLTRSEAQQVVHAFVAILNCTIPATPTSSPSMSPPSFLSATFGNANGANLTSYEMLSFGGYSTGDEDLKDFDNEEQGNDPSPLPLQCPTCALPMAATGPSIANASSTPSAAIISTTTIAETPAPVVVKAHAIAVPTSPAAAPVLTPAASSAVVTVPVAANSAATTTTTVSVTAVVVAPAASAAPVGPAAPPYSQLPLGAPSNAILPPPHLVTVGHGYHVPGPNDNPPFYVITRGHNIGVFSGWFVIFPMYYSFNS